MKKRKINIDKFIIGNIKHNLFENILKGIKKEELKNFIKDSLLKEKINKDNNKYNEYFNESLKFANDLRRFKEIYIDNNRKLLIEDKGKFKFKKKIKQKFLKFKKF